MPIPVMAPTPPKPPYVPPAKTPLDPTSQGLVHGHWKSPDGVELDLWDCSTGVSWLAGRGGTDMPPFEFSTQENIDDDGQTITNVRAKARTLTLPLLVHQPTFGAWRKMQQAIVAMFDPTRGDGELTITQPDGETRVLRCRYGQGMEGVDIADPRGLWYRLYPLQLVASDPWWYAPKPVEVKFGAATAGVPFLAPPFLPLKLTASTVLGQTTASNSGDAPVYPVWTVTGPAGLTTFTNRSTGRSFSFNLGLTAGQSVTINTTPRAQSVVAQPDGTNLFNTRVGTPDFWPLLRGLNQVTLDVVGADDGTTVSFAYTPRYLTA